MMNLTATRNLLTVGLLLAVATLFADPGLGAAVAVVAYIGWLRETTLRTSALDRLAAAATELEAAGKRYDKLQAVLDDAVITRIEYKLAESHGTVH
jgi:hypothetical protein